MLSAPHRLRRQADIEATWKKGRRVRTAVAVAAIRLTTPGVPARVTVIVGKRVSPLAVRRHRLQRLWRQLVREIITDHPYGYDMVITATPAAARIRTLDEARGASASIFNHLP